MYMWLNIIQFGGISKIVTPPNQKEIEFAVTKIASY